MIKQQKKCTTFGMQTIRPLSAHAFVLSGRMVCTLSVMQCEAQSNIATAKLHYTWCADHKATECTCLCTEWPDGLHTECYAV